jgi:hypothetical protein
MKRRSFRAEVGVFPTEDALLAAAAACRQRGVELLDAHTPYPVHGIDDVLGIRRTRLPYVTFAGGVLGLVLALWLQYWSSAVDYPLNVGGKPFDSLPAFIPVAFEMLVLCAGLLTVAVFLLRSRLAPGRRARAMDPRITDDRFALVVRRRDASIALSDLQQMLRTHGALEHWSEVTE